MILPCVTSDGYSDNNQVRPTETVLSHVVKYGMLCAYAQAEIISIGPILSNDVHQIRAGYIDNPKIVKEHNPTIEYR
jgi:hypothetical protein